MSFFDDFEPEDPQSRMDETMRTKDYYLMLQVDFKSWDFAIEKLAKGQYEKDRSMQAIGTLPDINNWLYVGEDCFEVERNKIDGNVIKLVETSTIEWKELESTTSCLPEVPPLRVSLAQIDPKREYRIFTAVGKSCDFTGDSKVEFLGVFTIDYIECIYRNRMVLRKVSDKLVF